MTSLVFLSVFYARIWTWYFLNWMQTPPISCMSPHTKWGSQATSPKVGFVYIISDKWMSHMSHHMKGWVGGGGRRGSLMSHHINKGIWSRSHKMGALCHLTYSGGLMSPHIKWRSYVTSQKSRCLILPLLRWRSHVTSYKVGVFMSRHIEWDTYMSSQKSGFFICRLM